jgi:putative copper export protein
MIERFADISMFAFAALAVTGLVAFVIFIRGVTRK